ncbi:MAG: hypothetical protein H7315_19805 [Herminiimonas sp.]|nr:hypothetical protein [Herminiimonas sp.]
MNKNFIASAYASVAAVALLLAAPLASARDNVHWSVNVGSPGVVYPAYYGYPAPVYAQPAPVYSVQQPVYVEQGPVYYQSREVYVTPPVYYSNVPQPYYWNREPRLYGYQPGYGRGGRYEREGHWHR